MKKLKTYITTESWVRGTKNGSFIEPFIPKGSGIVIVDENNGKIKFYHQGHLTCTMDVEIFSQIPKIEKDLSDEYIYNYIVPNQDIKTLNNLFKKIRKIYSKDKLMSKVISTLHKWIFLTKGSSAIKGKEYESLNFNNLPWVKNNGFSTKPFHFNENRSGRTTIAPNENEILSWENNPYNVLPIGIRISEQCTYPEMFKIGKKLFQELCGIEGVDQKFKDIVIEFLPDIDKNYKHYDYMTGERISLSVFEKNTHHGKIKGLELCHLDPTIELSTTSNNITIGFCDSNRKQSGNSVESMGFNGLNASLIKMGKSPITLEEYNNLLLSI
jgi:hypothetical protein